MKVNQYRNTEQLSGALFC